jgi:ABC-type multidrug transport system fused ATPase/permease subunit
VKFKSHLAREYTGRNKSILSLIIFTGLLQSCISFLLPVTIGDFFSIQYNAGSSKGRLLQLLGIHFSSLQAFFLFFLFLLALKGGLSLAEQWMSLKEGEKFVRLVRERVFNAQINQDTAIFQQRAYGNYLLRYSNDLKAVRNYLLRGILGAVKNSLFLFIGFVLLAIIHFQLTMYLVILFSFFLAGIYFLTKYQKQFIQRSRDKRSNLLAFVTKSFSRYKRIKEQNNEQATISRFNEKSGHLFEANMNNNCLESVQESLVPFLQYAMLVGLLFLSTIVTPAIHYADALIFVLVILMLFSSMRRVLKVPGILTKGNISLQKIEVLMQGQAEHEITIREEIILV